MNPRKFFVVGALALTFLTTPSSSSAEMLRRISIDTLVMSSDLGVIARAVSADTTMTDGQVMTHTTFIIDEVLFGDSGAMVTVVTPGGVVRGGPIPFMVTTDGVPVFNADDKVVLLLTESSNGLHDITGFSQGHFPIRGEGLNAELVVEGSANPVPLNRFADMIRRLR
ncbi:MAG: hypothetical protein AAF225_04245 [Pseudomonadota bacterium]